MLLLRCALYGLCASSTSNPAAAVLPSVLPGQSCVIVPKMIVDATLLLQPQEIAALQNFVAENGVIIVLGDDGFVRTSRHPPQVVKADEY